MVENLTTQDATAERNYREIVRLLASGQEFAESQRDMILSDAGKSVEDLQADIQQAQRMNCLVLVDTDGGHDAGFDSTGRNEVRHRLCSRWKTAPTAAANTASSLEMQFMRRPCCLRA